MSALLIKLVLAPALMVAATLAARRWGPRIGGAVAAFPAIVGPLLLLTALEYGDRAAARAAAGTLLGLIGLGAFAFVYTRTARVRGWAASVASGWLAAGLSTGMVGPLSGATGPVAATLLASAALLGAAVSLGGRPGNELGIPTRLRPGIAWRAVITGLLVTLLSGAVGWFGPTAGGILAALPVLTSLLAAFTHREAGAAAAVSLLRGTLAGMAGFVAFCGVVALTVVGSGPLVGFVLATAVALLLQGLAVGLLNRLSAPRGAAARSRRFGGARDAELVPGQEGRPPMAASSSCG